MDDKSVYSGSSRRIEWAVLPNGSLPGLKVWKKLGQREKAKLLKTITRLGDTGEVRNEERFKHEQGKIYAIKASIIRIYCFETSDNRYVLTNIVTKKQRRARTEDLERAEWIRNECVNK